MVSALGDVMPRIPLMEYEEPAESVLTDDTCVTEPVDTVQRERGWSGPGGRAVGGGRFAGQPAKTTALTLHWAGCHCLRSSGSAGCSECSRRTPALWQRLHLGDGGSPRGICPGFLLLGGCKGEHGQLGGLTVQKGTQDSVRRAVAQILSKNAGSRGTAKREGGAGAYHQPA